MSAAPAKRRGLWAIFARMPPDAATALGGGSGFLDMLGPFDL